MVFDTPKPLLYEWSRAVLHKPKDSLISHRMLNVKRFVPSYEKPCSSPPNMFCLLGWQYQRIWRCELNKILDKREHEKKKQSNMSKPDLLYNKNRFAKKSSKKSKKK